MMSFESLEATRGPPVLAWRSLTLKDSTRLRGSQAPGPSCSCRQKQHEAISPHHLPSSAHSTRTHLLSKHCKISLLLHANLRGLFLVAGFCAHVPCPSLRSRTASFSPYSVIRLISLARPPHPTG